MSYAFQSIQESFTDFIRGKISLLPPGVTAIKLRN